jgi:hypothetical protein
MILPELLVQSLFFMAAPDCETCHRQQARSQRDTPMAHALIPASESNFLHLHPDLSFNAGDVSYRIRFAGGAVTFSVASAGSSLSTPLVWAFGNGTTGQTYLFRRNESWYEAAVSFYPAIQGLDWTPGHSTRPHSNVEEALGRRLDNVEARRCFGCHSTLIKPETSARPDSLQPGITCEACHQNAQAHQASLTSGPGRNDAPMGRLSELGPEDLSAVCNNCHPGWAEVSANGPRGVPNVRHQFYRLIESRCYDTQDKRISCTACHDLHSHVTRPSAFYDSKCQSCHATGKVCPVAKNDCVRCHMPKTELPGLHFAFTDHRIRIARPGQQYPD